jgi:hypothetical protein
MATAVATSQQQLDVAVIDTPENVRDLDAEHVKRARCVDPATGFARPARGPRQWQPL